MLTVKSFYDVSSFAYQDLFPGNDHVWGPLKTLKAYMDSWSYLKIDTDLIKSGEPLPETLVFLNGSFEKGGRFTIEFGDATKGKLKVYDNGRLLENAAVIMAGAVLCGSRISLGSGVLVESGAFIKSPTIIGDRTEIRQGAYLRGYCLAGKRCVLGHVTEIKHSILLDDAKAGHFAYLGDSILGNNVNLGAGTKLANLRFIPGNVQIKTEEGMIDTGLRKLGALLGDHVQTGCNSVTNPGTMLGMESMVMPNMTVPSGFHKRNSIIR
ncbi:MAG: hypothetical protein KAR13_20560 [Desulfobulbaceae bacterium]|nr:hypothetical protein [Desulfobulbaceae bacterium]MCK5436691.1 hypothetical protein [Desulfobulbaceae bacterium]MCK5543877.1 hypothetical protein [Desulfobulbaceae bacterium]